MSNFRASIQYLSRYFNKELKSQPHGGARGKVRGLPKSAVYIVPNCVQIHVVNVEIFDRISENCDLLVVLEERSWDHCNVSSRDLEYL